MSKPITQIAPGGDLIQYAMAELVSAQSALNMAPVPMKHDPEDFYLSQVDAMAAHSMEHMRATFDLLRQADRERESLLGQIRRLEIKLKGKELIETEIPDAENWGARITVNEKGEEVEDDNNA